jgi:hypothetical protein
MRRPLLRACFNLNVKRVLHAGDVALIGVRINAFRRLFADDGLIFLA